MSVAFLSSVELAIMESSNYVKQRIRETEDTLLRMAEEGNYEEYACCLTKEEHKVTEVFR